MTEVPCTHVQLRGKVWVALPPAEAFALFTPSGERGWVPGWEPKFACPGTPETEPGTVFTICHDGRRSVWAVVCCETGPDDPVRNRDPGRTRRSRQR